MSEEETGLVFASWLIVGYVVAAVWYVIARRRPR
jgi:hypothetical protein